MVLSICICDDDSAFCDTLANLLRELEPESSVSVFTKPDELIGAFSRSDALCDLFLLDINLRNRASDGISLAKRLHAMFPASQIVFVTAYPEYVSDVYETEHCYFIKKSDLGAYLPRAIDKAKRTLSERDILLISGAERVKIKPSEITFIERYGRKTIIACSNGKRLSATQPLEALEAELPEYSFARCHNSFIVSLERVASMSRTELFLDDGQRIPVSRSRYAQFQNKFIRFVGREM